MRRSSARNPTPPRSPSRHADKNWPGQQDRSLWVSPSLGTDQLFVRSLALFRLRRPLFWRHKLLLPLPFLLLLLCLCLFCPLRLRHPLLCIFPEEVLSALDLHVHLALLGRRRERRVRLLGLVCDIVRYPSLGQRPLLEIRQVAAPVFVGEGGVFGELAFDPVPVSVVLRETCAPPTSAP